MLKRHSMLHGADESRDSTQDNRSQVRFDTLKAYIAEVGKYPLLSQEEEHEITRLIYEDQDLEAIEKLAVSNLRLVVKIAVNYRNSYLNMLDLIQEGNVGLLHAVKKFNPYKGSKFCTYAQFWIRAYILKYIMDSWSLVKIGTTQSQRKLFYRLNKEKRRLESLGICPAPKLLATNLIAKEREVVEMEARLSLTDVYLETPVNDDGRDTLMDMLAADEDVEKTLIENEALDLLSKKIKEFKTSLNEKELCILDLRLMAEDPKTLEEIGSRFHISRERVRQIEQKILKKARVSLDEAFGKMDIWPACNGRTMQNVSIAAGAR
ncbi:MAG: RNA polymerase sigma factor RpoH [Syntrophorhabdus sp. PtaU1.Bin153]|nr:MAG: RNA polymerase sigma factor RpoH [Syntrophorhabdus sp. PtaU1.Bin153]